MAEPGDIGDPIDRFFARYLIVTGATGYIGARLVATAIAEGRAVTVLGRRPGPPGTRHIAWRLGDPLPAAALDPTRSADRQALVHLAHDWRGDDACNVDATGALFASARDAGLGARVFVSSQSARRDALNRYGRMKWASEQRLAGGSALRVGLVYGGAATAMYGLLCRITRLPVLPMVDPHRTVQPIHLDEVVQGLLAAADYRATGVLALAGPVPIAFGAVLKALALAYRGRRLAILPVPLRLALILCDATARLPLIPTVDRERVLGLAGTEEIDSAGDLARLGVAVRPLAERLAQEPAGRRATLAEARAFLVHAGAEPRPALLRRYVRAVPAGAIARPRLLLRWREPIGGGGALAARLRVAARIAEAGIGGERRLAGGSRTGRLLRLGMAMAVEGLMLPTRLIATAMAR